MFYVFILVHLSVFEFASIGLKLVSSSLKKGAGVPENCVLACVCKVELKGITLSRLCYHSSESTRGTNTTLCLAYHICYICYIYIYIYIYVSCMYIMYVTVIPHMSHLCGTTQNTTRLMVTSACTWFVF